MNWPFDSKLVKELNQTAYDRVYDYMQSHAHEFLLNNEKTHKRAQAIADAVNAEDPSKCGADSVLAENIIACIKSMREHIVDYYPNAIVACGHDPSVLFMLADTEAESKTTCVCFTITITDWKTSSGTASK